MLIIGDTTRCKPGGRGAATKAAGAAGMLIQSVPLGLNSLGGNADFQMASIESAAGADLIAEEGGAPLDFSSWGFDGDIHLKPDIDGPSGNILSTYPVSMGSYAIGNSIPLRASC